MLSRAKKLAVFALFGLALPRCGDLFPSNSVSGDAAVALTCTAFAVAASGATGSPGLVCALGSGTFTSVENCATSCSSPNVAVCNAGNLNPSSFSSFMSYTCNGTTYYSLSEADIAAAVSQGVVTCNCNPCDPSTGATCP